MSQYYKDAFAKEHTRIIGEGLREFDNNLSISTETIDPDEVTERLEQPSPDRLDDMIFESASWNNPIQIQDYFNLGIQNTDADG